MAEKKPVTEQATEATDEKGIVSKVLSPHFAVSREDGSTVARIPVVASLAVVLLNPVVGVGVHAGAWAAAKLTGNEVGIKQAD